MRMIQNSIILIALLLASIVCAAPNGQRQILVCVSEQASPAVKQAAQQIVDRAISIPVLKALLETQGAGPVNLTTSESVLKNYNQAAYNHLVVVGLKSSDALMEKVWEHYATVTEDAQTIYMQGWGYLRGDIGYVEADRNPFLHSRRIKSAPFETLLFKISGTTEDGLLAGVNAFQQGMLNGLVPDGDVTRPETTLLDLDPLMDGSPIRLPLSVSLPEGNAPLVGYTQVPGNEYRAYIDVAGAEPTRVWRLKYLPPHAFDKAGVEGWMAGFHRMAYGNAVNIVEFATEDQAKKSAEAIGQGNGWRKVQDVIGVPVWQADQPTDEILTTSLGKVTALAKGRYLIMTTLAPEAVTTFLAGCVFPLQ